MNGAGDQGFIYSLLSNLSGLSFGKILSNVAMWGFAGTMLKVLWNSRVPMRKIKVDANEKLIENLLQRVEKLEAAKDQQTKDYEARITNIIAENEAREVVQEAQQALLRHELQNTRQCFNALLMLLKRVPNLPPDIAGIIEDIKEMRSEQVRNEDLERAALSPAKSSLNVTPTILISPAGS